MEAIASTHPYVELHCHSALSLLDGASLPAELAAQARALHYNGLAITDHDELGGIVGFGVACAEQDIPGILGVELTVRMPALTSQHQEQEQERHTHLVLLAETAAGYANIATLVTHARMHTVRGEPSVPWSLVAQHATDVTALTGCPRGWIPQLLAEQRPDDAWIAAGMLREVFGIHLAIECWDHQLTEERALVRQLRPLARRLGVPWVVTNDVHYATPDQRIIHDVLCALRHGLTLDAMGTRLRPNAEWALKAPAHIYHRWHGAEDGLRATLAIGERCAFRLKNLEPSMPAFTPPNGTTAYEFLVELVEQGARERWKDQRTDAHDRQLAHELDLIRKRNLSGFFLIMWDIMEFARREGILCQGRGSAANSAICYCLKITAIDPVGMKLLFERFMSEDRNEYPDIDVDFAHRDRERVLQYVYDRYGRQHAAMVCEQITWRGRSAIRDSARVLGFSPAQAEALTALSDRFSAQTTAEALRVEEHQPKPPTQDLRFPLTTHPTHNPILSQSRLDWQAERKIASDARANIGPLAKGPDNVRPGGRRRMRLDPSSRMPDRPPARVVAEPTPNERLQQAGFDPNDPRVRQLAHIVRGLDGLPRHRSIHVGGFVLTEQPLGSVVPIEPASMPGRTVIQWEKDDLDSAGLVKIDLLGLGMLTVVQDCLLYLRHTRDLIMDLSDIDLRDPAVYDTMCRADTVGVFQIESRAQMNTLPRLKPRAFYDLVVEVALIRPGPIQGDMVHPYLRRRNGQEPVTYPHPSLESILERTMGVPLFQEQGMQVAIAAAGFTPTQADQLRRAMGHKRSHARMAAICEELITGMVRNGIPQATAERIYRQINAFADYGFPESHAASFALIVYATAWLRYYYPAEYLCAMLNAQPMGFYSPGTLVEDAKRHGVEVRPIDLTRSGWDHSLELADDRVLLPSDGTVQWASSPSAGQPAMPPTPASASTPPAVRLGLRLVRGLGAHARRALEAALQSGPFTSIPDAVERVTLDRRAWRRIAEAGAFDSLFAHEPPERRRRVALWEVMAATRAPMLPFAPRTPATAAPHVPSYSPVELSKTDYRATGLSMNGHLMTHVRPSLARHGVLTAQAANQHGQDGQTVAVAGLVICRQQPGTAKGFVFLTLEDETGMVNIVVTPQLFAPNARLISRSPVLLIRGILETEQTVVNIRAAQFKALALDGGEQYTKGRDYH